MKERRKHKRLDTNISAHAHFQGTGSLRPADCVVKDISDTGARLIAFTAMKYPAAFEISVDEHNKQACTVRWRANGQLGVEFI